MYTVMINSLYKALNLCIEKVTYTPYQLQLKQEKGKSNFIMFNNICKLITKIRFFNNSLKFIIKIGIKYRFRHVLVQKSISGNIVFNNQL